MSNHPCIGIDLGTTYSALAFINAAGRPEIVSNADGERITRSAIFFDENGSVVVGESAKNTAPAYPEKVAQWVKRRMGDMDWRFDIDGKSYSAIDLSAMILKKVKKDAEARLGQIKYAVVTVPAYFDDIRRNATIAAAKLAGLELLEVINEPTAAAIAYASTGGRPGKILVYDLGGGTFDVSIVEVKDAFNVRVIATDGDHRLGGHDLDIRLARYFGQKFQESKNVRLIEDERLGYWLELIKEGETAKKELSKREKAKSMIAWKGHALDIDIARPDFEKMISQELTRTKMLVESVLDAANLKPSDIDEVLLVGGSTRIPAVKNLLKNMFRKEPIAPVNVDEAVALGAAIKAGLLMHQRGLTDLSPQAAAIVGRTKIQDVTSQNLGTLAMCEVGGVEKLRNVVLIEKNSPIPISKTETFYTRYENQEQIKCSVTEGGEHEGDPEFVNKLLLSENAKLPDNLPAGNPIEITYSFDANQNMRFVFKDGTTGQTLFDSGSMSAKLAQQHTESVEADFDDLEIE